VISVLHDIGMVVLLVGVAVQGYVLGRLHNPAPFFDVEPDPVREPEADNVIELRARRAA
jgi:hypothetical protein